MNFQIPIFVQEIHGKNYLARPLFSEAPARTGGQLNKLYQRLSLDIVRFLESQSKEARHDHIARLSFAPVIQQHRVKMKLVLRTGTVDYQQFFVSFEHLGRKLVFSPNFQERWYEIPRQQTLENVVTEAMQKYWQSVAREDEDFSNQEVTQTAIIGKAWVHILEINANIRQTIPKEKTSNMFMLGDEAPVDGNEELQRVGHCLEDLYPDELLRAVQQDSLVEELVGRLQARPFSPVLLVGPRMVGKTTLIHEAVFQRNKGLQRRTRQGNLWHISPQRLISGMSYLGQWESRLHAIMKVAQKRQLILYFDDLVGLFLAGRTSNSTLNVAQLLKPAMERQEIRVLAEITPEQLRVLREMDRSFADLFQILPVAEPTDEQNWRILLSLQRHMEGKFSCTFDLDVLPTIIDIQKRYERTASFPGKVARVINRLAVRAESSHTSTTNQDKAPTGRVVIGREQVLDDFQQQSGLSLKLFDTTTKLPRQAIWEALKSQIIQQDEALLALVDTLGIVKARLNDPDRPLASMLFLGPTGVGKTETAKALTRYLFEDEKKMLRFDMNEYVHEGAAAKLVGTVDSPEGLLTAAIRRQPFAVVLLDEIEKAHPEVFDLLLQVLGEGRLTDSLGRTADFTNCIIILTSNLGVTEAEAQVGFTRTREQARGTYLRSAERFFRPEFFNRLDRIIPFERLSRSSLAEIARKLMLNVFARPGLQQRQCVMDVSENALNVVIEKGFDPVLGARAMKRAVEKLLTQPAATQLAAQPLEHVCLVAVDQRVDNTAELDVNILPILPVAPLPMVGDHSTWKQATWENHLDNLLEQADLYLQSLRPRGAISATDVAPEIEKYLLLKELIDDVEGRFGELTDHDEILDRVEISSMTIKTPTGKRISRDFAIRLSQPMSAYFAAEDMQRAIEEIQQEKEKPHGNTLQYQELVRRLSLYEWIRGADLENVPCTLILQPFPRGIDSVYMNRFANILSATLQELLLEVKIRAASNNSLALVLQIRGFHATKTAALEEGIHIWSDRSKNIFPILVRLLPRGVEWNAENENIFTRTLPKPLPPVVRTYTDSGLICDIRTGMVLSTKLDSPSLADFLLINIERMTNIVPTLPAEPPPENLQ
ncbi:MAG: AAA family ATPase [Zavarzinella sp.]